jgi:hypothetical protein
MTRDKTIEKVARAICRVQCKRRGAMACDGIFDFDDGCSGYTEFWEIAQAAVAAMEEANETAAT